MPSETKPEKKTEDKPKLKPKAMAKSVKDAPAPPERTRYRVKNTSRILIHEDLGIKDAHGNMVVLSLRRRETKVLTEAQWKSRVVQRHIKAGLLKSARV